MEKHKNKDNIRLAIKKHQQTIANLHMRDFFADDDNRTTDFTIQTNDLFIDFSKNRITRETISLLLDLANSINIKDKISDLLDGKIVNITQQRPALHTALRSPSDSFLKTDNTDISSLVHKELARIKQFVERLHSHEISGSTGKPIKKIINIGIGGSDLGPRLVVDALYEYQATDINIDFVANLDAHDLYKSLDNSDPETTLFIVTSKSFSTLETQTNAQSAKQWLLDNGCKDINKHFIAVSSNKHAVKEFGISEDRIFAMWDWVGGRYSVWSTAGLPVAISLGMNQFSEFLAGAHAMDLHFSDAPLEKNIPVILGLLDLWYNNFFNAETLAVVPYDQRLRLLPDYLSQLIMESNGKGVDEEGNTLDFHSSPIVWGSIGTNAQHAFFQMLHQGTRLVPVEFLLPLKNRYNKNHHKLVANCIAQGKALMQGQENKAEPHKNFPGNRPSTTIIYEKLTPRILGMILAMYEHRTFVQAKVWGINPFDQWGVELGKTLANEIIKEFEGNNEISPDHDASTTMLINRFQKNR